MEFNKDKVDDFTLALMFLVMHDENKYGARAWKGFDWDTMDRLHAKGFISNPVGKAKSVVMTPSLKQSSSYNGLKASTKPIIASLS